MYLQSPLRSAFAAALIRQGQRVGCAIRQSARQLQGESLQDSEDIVVPVVPFADYEVEAGGSCQPFFLMNIERCQTPVDFDLLSASHTKVEVPKPQIQKTSIWDENPKRRVHFWNHILVLSQYEKRE